jgi:Cd2+/Zn2+-exporting ATPase
MDTKNLPPADGCGSAACTVPPNAPAGADARVFRIATMDCSAEEAEIRRALDPVPGIRSLNFQLGARTLGIDAPLDVLPRALDAIRNAGFNPDPVNQDPAHAGADNGQSEPHDHDHEPGRRLHASGSGVGHLLLRLKWWVYFCSRDDCSGSSRAWLLAGSCHLARWPGRLQKRHGRADGARKLNINALMSVAVTGAFADRSSGPRRPWSWRLYAIAELIEARAVDRARNAIKGLLDLAPEEALVLGADDNWPMAAHAGDPGPARLRLCAFKSRRARAP